MGDIRQRTGLGNNRPMEKRPLFVLAALTLLAFSAVLLLRSASLLEGLELRAHDAFLRLTGDRSGPSEPLVMVEYTEEDETAFGFPLPDDRLADLFDVLTEKGAVAIGLDLIRDRQEPQIENLSAFERLSGTLRENPSIIAIVKDGANAFGPPPALADRPLQVASATILPDSLMASSDAVSCISRKRMAPTGRRWPCCSPGVISPPRAPRSTGQRRIPFASATMKSARSRPMTAVFIASAPALAAVTSFS